MQEMELQELEWDKARLAKVGSSIWKPPDPTSASLPEFLLGLRVLSWGQGPKTHPVMGP